MKLLLCLFVICASVAAQNDDSNSAPEYFDNYDDHYDYSFLKEEGEKIDKDHKELDDQIASILNKIHDELGDSAENAKGVWKDYITDDSKEQLMQKTSAENENIDNIETLPKDEEIEEKEKSTEMSSGEKRAKDAHDDYALLWGDDEPAPLQPPITDDKSVLEETQEILNEDDVNDFEEDKDKIALPVNNQSNLEEILEETKKLLADNEDDFDLPKTSSEKASDDNVAKEINSEEDTVDKVKQDLDEDLRKLFETIDKLTDDGSQDTQDTEEANSSSVQDYEDKYAKVDHEEEDGDYEEIMDSNLSKIFAKHAETSEVIDSGDQEEPNADDDFKESSEKKSIEKTTAPIMYQNDALVDESQRVNSKEVEEFKETSKSTQTSEEKLEKVENSPSESTTESQRKTKTIDELSDAQLDEVMSQFAMAHSEDLDVKSDGFSRDVAPVHITLSVDHPTIVTSPNYPNNYPTNNVVDWIFEGQGMGIEMNITSFAVNGAIGDYVLVKPGGIDDSGHEGLVFTYHLNSERRYRFGDVDRMFMRFEARMGMSFTRGFNMSLQMMAPLPIDPEDMPAPEAVLPAPSAVMTVNLAGVDAVDFKKIREDFRELIADMATEYISDNKIDRGMNATIEVTQITSHGICNINWPGHEECVSVTFGVPLTYEEDMEYRLNAEDLQKVWKYIEKKDFRRRLEALGVVEFTAPNDQTVLTMWLVIAAGVVISMALLAFALWRFSCFDDYTRMQNFSDTDSIKAQKRDLDLYPTPHQTLPPLYSENDYKWADLSKFDDSARVDMGGFANRSYTRDDMYDLDYEEEVPNSDRDKSSPRDFYSNV